MGVASNEILQAKLTAADLEISNLREELRRIKNGS
jgi:hypothetical protein